MHRQWDSREKLTKLVRPDIGDSLETVNKKLIPDIGRCNSTPAMTIVSRVPKQIGLHQVRYPGSPEGITWHWERRSNSSVQFSLLPHAMSTLFVWISPFKKWDPDPKWCPCHAPFHSANKQWPMAWQGPKRANIVYCGERGALKIEAKNGAFTSYKRFPFPHLAAAASTAKGQRRPTQCIFLLRPLMRMRP